MENENTENTEIPVEPIVETPKEEESILGKVKDLVVDAINDFMEVQAGIRPIPEDKPIEKKGEKAWKGKVKAPILTPAQLLVFIIVQIIGIVQGMLPVILGESFSALWFIFSFGIDNLSYFAIMTLRGVKPDEMPDTSAATVLKNILHSITDFIVRNRVEELDPKHLEYMNGLEQILVWVVREWDLVNMDQQSVLDDTKVYMQSKLGLV